MGLRTKIVALAVAPLIVALALVAVAVNYQQRDLAAREREILEHNMLAQRRAELRSYVDLAASTVRSLHDADADGNNVASRDEALRRLAALDYGSDGYYFVYDLQGRVLMHSRQPELVGRNLWDLRDSQGRPTIRELIEQARRGGGFVEYEWRKPSSTELAPKLGYVTTLPRWNWMMGTGIYLDDVQTTMQAVQKQVSDNVGTTMLWIAAIAALGLATVSAAGVLLNLSEHKVAEARLRVLARRVVRSQEDERGHLSRELHDGVSQTLVSAKLLIESAADALERAAQTVPVTLLKAQQRLNESLAEVRGISHRLRPALLDTLGLPAALEHLGAEFGEEGAARAHMRIDGEPFDLPQEVNTALFRVAQEALTNVRKHAQAQQVRVVLTFRRGGVQLEIGDDGCGFDPEALRLDPHRGIGLRNMRERLDAIGGQLDVRADGQGTRIVASAPVAGWTAA